MGKKKMEKLNVVLAGARLYRIWLGIKTRGTNKKERAYPDYGGRGIKICKRWLSFENFVTDVVESYLHHFSIHGEDTSLDRRKNDGHYSPNNFRWATRLEQGRNKRNNVLLTYEGETRCVGEWARKYGLRTPVLWSRIFKSKWPLRKALTAPLKTNKIHFFDGKKRDLKEIAEITGIGYECLADRIRKGQSLKMAVKDQRRLFFFNGERLTLKELAERYSIKNGIGYKTLVTRIKRDGWPIERAVTFPPKIGYNGRLYSA